MQARRLRYRPCAAGILPALVDNWLRNGPEITSLFRLGIADKSGGRRRFIDVIPQVEENFLAVPHEQTAGDPMRREVKWTNLPRREICVRLAEQGTRPMGNKQVRKFVSIRSCPVNNSQDGYLDKY